MSSARSIAASMQDDGRLEKDGYTSRCMVDWLQRCRHNPQDASKTVVLKCQHGG